MQLKYYSTLLTNNDLNDIEEEYSDVQDFLTSDQFDQVLDAADS